MESPQHRRSTGGNLGGRPKTNEAKQRLVLRLRDWRTPRFDGSSRARQITADALRAAAALAPEQEEALAPHDKKSTNEAKSSMDDHYSDK